MGRNPGTAWPLTVGMTPAEPLGEALPVYPRYNIRWDASYPIFCAFLGQPIVPVGHHEDAAHDLELLRISADLINSLGAVQWTDLQSIARANFISQRRAELLHVKMYSRRIELVVPEGVQRVFVERPWTGGAEAVEMTNFENEARARSDETLTVHAGEKITISALRSDAVEPSAVKRPPTPLWAIARRQLCEGRDRLRPTLDRLRGGRNGAAKLAQR